MLKHVIADKAGTPAEVNEDPGEDTGLVVATRPHKTFVSKTVYFTNSTYGREMAQDGAFNAVVWTIHDGTDTDEADAGNCDGIGTDTNKLEDTGQNFESTVVTGMSVHNSTDGTYSYVTSVTDDEGLAVLDDIMDDGDDYFINPEWTFSEPVGLKWVEDSTAQAHTGTKSLLCDNANVGAVMQLLNINGTDVPLSNCIAVSMWIRVGAEWVTGDSVSFYGYNDGAEIGNRVYLEDYFDYTTWDVWQYISIPLIDLGLTAETLDAFRFQNEARAGAKSPTFWIDEIEFQVSGASIDYSVVADVGTWFHIKAFQTTFVGAHVGTLADATMPKISYDQFLDMIPTTGYVYKRYSGGETKPIAEVRITNLMDLLSLPYSKISNLISDGTDTLLTIENSYPTGMDFVLKAEDLDKITYTIDDTFDDLGFFRISCQGYVEYR
jgi:hypothetical protein